MSTLKKFLLFIFIFISIGIRSQDLPTPMSPPRLVNDFANIFSEEQTRDLEQILRAYNDSTSTQIYVVTVDDLGGYASSDYAFRLGEKWKIGQKSKNNGAVILIKPKRGNSRGDAFIAVGYGLEEKLNDARIGRIIDNSMLPYFMQNDYYSGTKSAIFAMIKYLSGQFQAEPEDTEISTGEMVLAIILILLFIYFMSKIGKNSGGDDDFKGGRGGGFFPPIIGGGRRGNYGGGSFGGGSFGGGGGGSFGGGGAGRSW